MHSDASTSVGGRENNPIVSWEWDMGDTTYNEPSITYVYENPGVYSIDLNVEDSNECLNINSIDFKVLVSTPPGIMNVTQDFAMCVNDTLEITGLYEGVQYTEQPGVDFGGGLFLPDEPGTCFTSEITFGSFDPGSVVNDANNDILNLFVNMEHSYMGDLIITFICPNGQSMMVHQQGGNGTIWCSRR